MCILKRSLHFRKRNLQNGQYLTRGVNHHQENWAIVRERAEKEAP